jgi:hypothetical protein
MGKIELINKKKDLISKIDERSNYLNRLEKVHSKLLERKINQEIKNEFGNDYSFKDDKIYYKEYNYTDLKITDNISIDVGYCWDFKYGEYGKYDPLIFTGKVAELVYTKKFLNDSLNYSEELYEKYEKKCYEFNIQKLRNTLYKTEDKIREIDKNNYLKVGMVFNFKKPIMIRDVVKDEPNYINYHYRYFFYKIEITKITPKMVDASYYCSSDSAIYPKRKSKDRFFDIVKNAEIDKIDKRKIILNQLNEN